MPRVTSAEAGLVSARIALGTFFLFEGWDKLPWVTNPEQLTSIFWLLPLAENVCL